MKKKYLYILTLLICHITNAQIVNIPDANFKNKLLAASTNVNTAQDAALNNIVVDANANGQIEVSEAQSVSRLNLSSSNISSLEGINSFSSLSYLNCGGNTITSIDISNLSLLRYISCRFNQIQSVNLIGLNSLFGLDLDTNQLSTLNLNPAEVPGLEDLYLNFNSLISLNLTPFTNLRTVYCSANELTTLNVNGLQNLTRLDCVQNHLTSLDLNGLGAIQTLYAGENEFDFLDVSGLTSIRYLELQSNNLTTLNLNGLTTLSHLSCYGNQLNSLSHDGLTNLQSLSISDNQFQSLDVNNLTRLNTIVFDNNPLLTSVFLKNGSLETYVQFNNCPNLRYICADENQLQTIQSRINQYGYSDCHVNSYCSFTPGGEFYTIQGNGRFDSNNNGCDSSDVGLSNLNISITNGTDTGNLISNDAGNYHIDLQGGINILTPILENPTYFNVSPASATINFPTMASPYTQDFCIAPNGIHNDLEVSVIPIAAAVPGFDAHYTIIYKNKGTSVQNGNVNLVFNDAILDFVSANPVNSGFSTNNLSWTFYNLQPFETREIRFTMNLNSPTETPAVNNGDALNYTASIIGGTDETPNDNAFMLSQTVVNSFDPNDKTCLEGNAITPEMVGNYVHYLIRFENTGTFAAQNIVVADVIDAAKFDIGTLIPLNSSHQFYSRINGSKVEFIFENINLPFDDANNDGYVAFKIKTLPTLVIGDTFSNSANIYFDYNFPIITDPAITTIQTLATPDFEFGNYFKIYPNPAATTINLETKATIGVKSINIYNTLGQMVIAITNAENITNIDVSDLKAGTYFIKVNTDKGTANTKFIKE